jgi:hypothetical protein
MAREGGRPLRRLAQRHADAKDLAKAAQLLTQASSLGSQDAARELREINRAIARQQGKGGWFSKLFS